MHGLAANRFQVDRDVGVQLADRLWCFNRYAMKDRRDIALEWNLSRQGFIKAHSKL